MRTLFFFCCCAAWVLLLSGCLPGGLPPEGRIVENPVSLRPMTPSRAQELAVTSLGAWSMARIPGAAVRIAGNSSVEVAFAADVVREAGLLSGIYAAPSGLHLLTVQFLPESCRLILTDAAGKTVWRETYPLMKGAQK